MATTTWKQLVYDFADAIRTLFGTTDKIPVGQLASKISSIPKQGAKTIVPSTSTQTIAGGTYLSGSLTVSGDADLKAENIRQGVNIFGVNGSFDPTKVETGSFTLSEPKSSIHFNHSLGKTPTGFMIIADDYYYSSGCIQKVTYPSLRETENKADTSAAYNYNYMQTWIGDITAVVNASMLSLTSTSFAFYYCTYYYFIW